MSSNATGCGRRPVRLMQTSDWILNVKWCHRRGQNCLYRLKIYKLRRLAECLWLKRKSHRTWTAFSFQLFCLISSFSPRFCYFDCWLHSPRVLYEFQKLKAFACIAFCLPALRVAKHQKFIKLFPTWHMSLAKHSTKWFMCNCNWYSSDKRSLICRIQLVLQFNSVRSQTKSRFIILNLIFSLPCNLICCVHKFQIDWIKCN